MAWILVSDKEIPKADGGQLTDGCMRDQWVKAISAIRKNHWQTIDKIVNTWVQYRNDIIL